MTTLSRVEIAGYSIFISTQVPGAGIFVHSHEDLLSYVVYRGSTEILIDLGQPDYTAASSFYRSQAAHNGLAVPALPLTPLRRFFVTRAMQQGLSMTLEQRPGRAELRAANAHFGVEKSLVFEAAGETRLTITERVALKGNPGRGRLTLNFGDPRGRVETDGAIVLDGYRCRGPGKPHTLAPIQRGHNYGERRAAIQARWELGRALVHESHLEISTDG
jgi:hypothetical protein